MSRAFMPWYIGDYLRDTGHLNTEQHGAYLLLLAHCWQHGAIPDADTERAAITKLSVRRWHNLKSPIVAFFNHDGTQKRVTKELARASQISMTRVIIGQKGGLATAIARAKATANTPAKRQQLVGHLLQQTPQQNSSNRAHNHKERIEREEAAGSLATAPVDGALTRPPNGGGVEGKQEDIRPSGVSQLSRSDLEASFSARRAKG